jgi:hypothetical protein
MCKSFKYSTWNLCCLTLFHECTFKANSKKKSIINIVDRSGSGTGSGRFQKSDPDLVKNRLDQQR